MYLYIHTHIYSKLKYTFKIEEKTVISFDGYMNLPDDLNR